MRKSGTNERTNEGLEGGRFRGFGLERERERESRGRERDVRDGAVRFHAE